MGINRGQPLPVLVAMQRTSLQTLIYNIYRNCHVRAPAFKSLLPYVLIYVQRPGCCFRTTAVSVGYTFLVLTFDEMEIVKSVSQHTIVNILKSRGWPI